jgi:hypothetical protein
MLDAQKNLMTLPNLFALSFGKLSSLLVALSASSSLGAVLTFDSATDYTNNFRVLLSGSALTHNTDGYLSYSPSPSKTSLNTYDLDGSGPGTTKFTLPVGSSLTVTTSVRFSGETASSVGIYFGTDLALFNTSHSGTTDAIRVFSAMSLTDGGVSNVLSGRTGLNLVTGSANASFTTFSATITATGVNSYSISLTVGSESHTHNFTTAAPTDFEVGLRVFNGAGMRIDVDSFDLTVVPEPSSSLLILGSLCGIPFIRRRL